MVDEFSQAQVPGEGGRHEQAGIGHQAMVVKEDADTVGFVLWQHLLGAPCFRAGFCSKTIIPDSEEHPLASSWAVPKAVIRWIRAKAEGVEERTEETRSFVRRVRIATRRKYTPEEKIRIVLEGFRREVTVSDLCRREGIKPHSYYAWTKEFMEAGKERLTRDAVRDAPQQEVQALRRGNVELKQPRRRPGPSDGIACSTAVGRSHG